MRRGHSGPGSWRNENHRHFGPRSGGTPHFRPSRHYGPSDGPRFPPSGPRFRGPYPHMPCGEDRRPPDHERYRGPGGPRPTRPRYDRPHHNRDNRQILPFITHMRQKDGDQDFNQSNYYEDNQFNVNAMGDVDLRQSSSGPSNSFNPRPIAPWVNAPFENRHYYNDNRSPHKTLRHQTSNESMPHEFTGHRPPASDHYAAPPGPSNNNTPYSRSVDDTVDIVRKRLLNRDSQQPTDESTEPGEICEDLQAHSITDYPTHHEQPVKKKAQKLKPINKNNCNKMKNKIVHQLFKMDKGKIHKLMDNPSSSSKFEYAISSLITESQNSLNRHLRSVAEKSLCNSSEEFINNDNNTIYEDTFMKQMQCILDPQDTVLLEDIKPLVLAELSKVLQLDDLSSFQSEDYGSLSDHQYYSETHDQYQDHDYYDPQYLEEKAGNSSEFPETDYNQSSSYSQEEHFDQDTKPLFERRPLKHRDYSQERQRSTESRQSDYSQTVSKNTDSQHSDSSQERLNKSIESLHPDHSQEKLKSAESRRSRVSSERSNDKFNELTPTRPDYDLEKLKSAVSRHSRVSSDIPDDIINEMGKPKPDYTIEKIRSAESRRSRISIEKPNDDKINELSKPQPDYTQEKLKSAESRRSRISSERPNDNLDELPAPVFDPNVEQLSEEDDPFADLDNQYHVAVDHNFIESEDVVSLITPSPVKSPVRKSPPRRSIKIDSPKTSVNIKNEIDNQLQTIAQSPLEKLFSAANYIRIEPETVKVKVELTKTQSTLTKQLSVEHKVPEHETDKFNNTDMNNTKSSQLNSRKRSIDQKPAHRKEKRKKNSTSESQDASKSMFNLFFSNIETKDTSKSSKKESTDKNYLEKYVKRKETPKKSKDPGGSKHETQNASSHSNKSPSDSAKHDSKTKLKPIDIFNDQPKKATGVHQAHRNTATPLTSVKSPDENKLKIIPVAQTSFARKLVKRHVGTQVVKKSREKEVQTDKQKHSTKAIQTEPVSFSSEKPKSIAKDPFERMKEIDMEIQVLLQEKFKLYNSLESKNNGGSSMENLGMTVLNMPIETTEDTSSINEDDIVDDFTNIPVEELEQLAMETVEESKRRPKRKIAHTRKSSESPTTKRSNRKSKTPNISLIEQIITDDRPLEDIISLDDFETTPKSKKKAQKSVPKKKSSKKKVSKQILPTIPELRHYYHVKDCSVVLIRTDIAKYLNRKTKSDHSVIENAASAEIIPSEETRDKSETRSDKFEVEDLPTIESFKDISIEHASQIVEEVVNDLQFDMLDVSEDIIIGDNCELKSGKENERVQITEEIILDNSQSSVEDTVHEAGSSNECKMYDYSTDENLRQDSMTVVGNADVVLAIECIENDFIAACLDGNVYHFSADGQLVNTLKGSNLGVTCLTIVKEKYGTTVYTGSLDSRIRYYDLETGLEKGPECNVLSPIQTMDRAWDTVFVGTRTGFVLQFECKNNMLIPVSTVKFSEQSILALRAMKEGPRKVLLVAARSEDVTVKDAQTGLLLRTLSGPKMTVYTLLFEDGKVYCGTSSPQIHVFDYTSGSHVGVHEGGKGAVCLRAMGGLVFAGCYDGCVYIYREGETRALAQLRGPSLMLLSLAVRGSKIIAGYKDRSLYIWKLPLSILQEMIL